MPPSPSVMGFQQMTDGNQDQLGCAKSTFFNPVLSVEGTCGDPDVLRATLPPCTPGCPPRTVWYMYTTAHWGIGCYSSPDLVKWTPAGTCGPNKWCYDQLYEQQKLGTNFFWAPCVIQDERRGQFVMFYSSVMEQEGGIHQIRLRVAKSHRPDGGFELVNTLACDRVFIDPFYIKIQDDQGHDRHFLYFATLADFDQAKEHGTAGIYVAELADDFSRFICEPTYLFGPNTHKEDWVTQGVNEAPWVMQISAMTYLLVYSGNLFHSSQYGLGYAISTTGPLGPFVKAGENPILQGQNGVVSPGHHTFVNDDEGKLWCIYHTDNPDKDRKEARVIYVDQAVIERGDQGFKIRINGPTVGKQVAPFVRQCSYDEQQK